jgi:predicted Zn finger-like uncharacterized protein
MVIVCQNCKSRFQLDDAKVPSGAFTVRCSKCQNTVVCKTPNGSQENVALGELPPTTYPRPQQIVPAPLFRPGGANDELLGPPAEPLPEVNEVTRALFSLLRQSGQGDQALQVKPSWDRQRALVCSSTKYREAIARSVAQGSYEVFVAEDTRQATERMRRDRIDVTILDPEFDAIEQGAAFVTREVNVLRPVNRRRMFFVQLSSSVRTMDMHAAFLHNVNLLVNFHDIDNLGQILDQALLEFNTLYKEFNSALGLSPL